MIVQHILNETFKSKTLMFFSTHLPFQLLALKKDSRASQEKLLWQLDYLRLKTRSFPPSPHEEFGLSS